MSSDTGKVTAQSASAGNVLDGYMSFTATTAATNVLVVPAGRTWVGQIAVSCACAENAGDTVMARATATISVAGTGATPPAGTILACDALAGANAAGGLTGTSGANNATLPLTLIAPAGNSVSIQAATTQAGDLTVVRVAASGALQ